MQVKKGNVGNLPLKMLVDMSSNVQPLIREWRARIWSLRFGQKPGVFLDEKDSKPSAIVDGFDSDDSGLAEPAVSAAVTSAHMAHAEPPQPAPRLAASTGVFVLRNAAGAPTTMCMQLSAPRGTQWGGTVPHQPEWCQSAEPERVPYSVVGSSSASDGGSTGESSSDDGEPVTSSQGDVALDNVTCDGMVPGRGLHHEARRRSFFSHPVPAD